jgi:hypothetical protein
LAKPSDYDPRTDSSVRVQAGKLRQKLDEYYRTEGAEDPLMVEPPKGGFHLEIRPRAAPVPASIPGPRRRQTRAAVALAALILLAAAF